jgi:hypothetical protein
MLLKTSNGVVLKPESARGGMARISKLKDVHESRNELIPVVYVTDSFALKHAELYATRVMECT